jgi:riboflavin transporter FmnP
MDKNILNGIAIILLAIFGVAAARVYFDLHPNKDFNRVRFITRIGIFAGFSAILYIIEIFTIKLPFFPSFLSLHFDEIPAFIAGFAYGPLSGLLVIVIKTVVKLPFTSTLGVGELTDLILSGICVFIVTFV